MKKGLCPLLTILLVIFLSACNRSTGNTNNSAKLQLTVQQQPGAFYYLDDLETLNNFSSGVVFQGVENAMISLDGQSLALEDAIRQKKITPELLDYYCSTDARDGLCIREQTSYHALNNKTFHYPTFSLRLVNDVLETPNRSQYAVSYLAIFNHLGEAPIVDDLQDPITKMSVTREDWGLDFEVNISDSVLHLKCSQSGGMQVGVLRIVECMILDKAGTPLTLSTSDSAFIDIGDFLELKSNDTANFSIKLNGDLPPESFYLSLCIRDFYDPSYIHPLIRKYHISQTYRIPLSQDS